MLNVDLHWWADVLIKSGAVSGALFAMWKIWLKPIVQTFQRFFAQHERMVNAVETELPKVNKAIEWFTDTITDHESRLSTIEGHMNGGSPAHNDAPLTPKRRRSAE